MLRRLQVEARSELENWGCEYIQVRSDKGMYMHVLGRMRTEQEHATFEAALLQHAPSDESFVQH